MARQKEYLFTPQEVQDTATAIRRVFNSEEGWDHYAISDEDTNLEVGAIQTMGANITIVFRGARGDAESLSCLSGGDGEVHEGFLLGYQSLRSSIRSSLEHYASQAGFAMPDMKFIIGGHSRGSGFVPQLVEDLLNEYDVLSENIRAICFSPLGVYSKSRAEIYNDKFGYDNHINFLIKEDSIDFYLKGLQYMYSVTTHIFQPPVGYIAVGNTLQYSAKDFQEFNDWVTAHPFVHLDPKAKLLSYFLSSISWGAHMPEAYEITAAKFLTQIQESRMADYCEGDTCRVI